MEVVSYVTNITERRMAEAEWLAAARQASISELAAGIAHVLRQPLSALSTAAQAGLLLLRRNDLANARQRVVSIETQARRAANRVGYLRRFGSHRVEDRAHATADLHNVIGGPVELASGALLAEGIELRVDAPAQSPVVRGEELVLVQVLITLLFNAKDAIARQPPDRPRRINVAVRG